MTIATRPYMMTGNAHLLPIDRNDPSLVLYLPLWYPHGDMTGSPIYSYDINRHTGTVTSAVWGSQGRTFAGGDDFIELAAESVMNFVAGDFSVIARINLATSTALQAIITRGVHIVDGWQMMVHPDVGVYFRTCFVGTSNVSWGGGDLSNGVDYTIGVSRVGTSVRIYVNGVDSTINAGTHQNPVTCARTVKIGISDDKAGSPFDGKLEFLAVYNRALTPGEHQNIHLAIKR